MEIKKYNKSEKNIIISLVDNSVSGAIFPRYNGGMIKEIINKVSRLILFLFLSNSIFDKNLNILSIDILKIIKNKDTFSNR